MVDFVAAVRCTEVADVAMDCGLWTMDYGLWTIEHYNAVYIFSEGLTLWIETMFRNVIGLRWYVISFIPI